MAKHNAQRNGAYYMMQIQVLSAKQQVVAGTNTVLEILVQESTCETGVNCPINFILKYLFN